VPELEDDEDRHRQTGGSEMKHTTVGVDIAKNVIQLHWVDPASGAIVNKSIKRAVLLEHLSNRTPCRIGMEACGGSKHWARRLIEMGHEVKLMPARFVKAFSFARCKSIVSVAC
jgi:transposase